MCNVRRIKMKIMYICGMYVPSHGGAEISMYSLLKNLKEKFNWEVLSVTDERYTETKINDNFNKVPIRTVNHSNRLNEIDTAITEFNPDIIMTQLMWSDIALKLAKKYSIPSIMRVCKVPLELDLSMNSKISPTAIISTSNSVKKYVKKKWNRKSEIIKPLIEIENYIIIDNTFKPIKNKLIFMFNPLKRKGGLILKEISKRLPEQKFGTVYGWSSLKENKNSKYFSSEYIERITESEGCKFDGSLPDYISFRDCNNIKIFKPEDDPKKIYEKIKILIIPSQWEEAFGRVSIEAMANGIPVIASNIAGLKDAVGEGGILLEKDDIKSWIEEIKKLNKENKYYKMWSKKGKEFVKKNYSEKKILIDFIKLVKSISKKD